MGPERSKPLHNFTLPYGLKWGNQRHLRCAKVESDGEIGAVHRRSNGSESIGRRGSNDPKFRSPEGIGEVREKLMFDLLTEADKMKESIFKKEVSPAKTLTGDFSDDVDLSRPWNLRTRRAACKEPNGFFTGAGAGGSKGGLKIDTNIANAPSSLRCRSGAAAGVSSVGEKKRQRVKYSVALSRREIDEDFMTMIGHRPHRRPKKRAKLVQKNLDTLFPGLWLTEITADLYKVPDDQ